MLYRVSVYCAAVSLLSACVSVQPQERVADATGAKPSSSSVPGAEASSPSKSIGQAEMRADGTLVLTLRAEGPGGAVGDGQFSYPPTHAQYSKMVAHVGGIRPGETKPVPPWPEVAGSDAGSAETRPTTRDDGLAQVRKASRVPLFLPTKFPGEPDAKLSFTAITSNADHFELVIGYEPSCSGGNACRYGSVKAHRRGTPGAPTPPRSDAKVRLADGTPALFADATCGAVCSDATLTFERGGYLYVYGLKAGKVADLLQMANSAKTH